MIRAFISIDIPKEIQKKIIKIQEQLPEFHGKLTEPKNLHLTLKFLGEIDEKDVEKVKERLREIKFNKFEMKIDEIGIFSEKFIRIVWLHLTNCKELQEVIDGKLKDLFEPEKRFMSHLTIARIKNLGDKRYFLNELKKIKIPEKRFSADNFKLKKSVLKPEGPAYETLQEYNLY